MDATFKVGVYPHSGVHGAAFQRGTFQIGSGHSNTLNHSTLCCVREHCVNNEKTPLGRG